jgi:8-oxo-dGTP diphosphatase
VTYSAKITKGNPIKMEHDELIWVDIQDMLSLDWAEADIPTVFLLMKRYHS